ncbi:MAG: bilirubin oxidase [Bacteroidetes bacterium]|nr:MAG: bilirubin oxidase [Bacteroidota bacterium]
MRVKLLFLSVSQIFVLLLSAQNPVLIPDTLSGTSFDLKLQHGTYSFFDGKNTSTMGVNGNILGPTLIMNEGDFVDIKVDNQLSDTTTIHWHGMHVSADNDGGPHTYILSGEVWNPSFTVMDKAGTYWYHPHLHRKTNEHVSKGIAGFIIVRDEEEAALELPRTYGVDDFPLAIQTKDFDNNGQIVTPSNADDVIMVNATIDPVLEVPAQIIRFRLLNGSSQRVFNVGLSGNQTFYQIGSDGGLLSKTNAITRLQMGPGERAEILIDLNNKQGQSLRLMSYAAELQNGTYGATEPGISPMMTLNGYSPNSLNGTNFDLIQFNVVAATGNPITVIPDNLANVNPIPESSAVITRNFLFSPAAMGPDQLNGNFLINGVSFNMDVINVTIPLNNIEIWSITNQSGITHPFHIHDVQFFVLDRNGAAPAASEQGRKDVIIIRPFETVRFITQFSDFANAGVPYMYHCHMLVHEDGGMMGQFDVVDNTTGNPGFPGESDEIVIFPNPVTDSEVSFRSKEPIKQYEIFNTSGKKLISDEINNKYFVINVRELNKGIYLVKLYSETNSYTKKLIKN